MVAVGWTWLRERIRLLGAHTEPIEQYYFDNGGASRIQHKMVPVVCIPTTVGSGSETFRGYNLRQKKQIENA